MAYAYTVYKLYLYGLLVPSVLKCLLHTSSSHFQLDTVERAMARVSSGIETKPRKIIIALCKFIEFQRSAYR